MKLQNRVALVTGAGTGMGRAIAELFAREGAKVAVNYSKSRDAADEVVAGIRGAGGTAIAIGADVSLVADVNAMIERVNREFGQLDILVNNAGWSTRIPHDQLDNLTDEIWDRTFDTNLKGAFYAVRSAVPSLRKQLGSSIVNVASVAGITGMGSSIAYAASKGAMITMTKSLARALAPEIRVNAIAPGFVRTRFANWPASAFDQGEAVTPLKHLATVEEIAALALYLVADAGSTTGETIVVDGGLTELGTVQMHTAR
ncbi:MAG: glucose 1-dehydrogenase [Bryobacteraceae bacterium]|jgi:3-oxoacyl-[acyl-carrier protein] reductase